MHLEHLHHPQLYLREHQAGLLLLFSVLNIKSLYYAVHLSTTTSRKNGKRFKKTVLITLSGRTPIGKALDGSWQLLTLLFGLDSIKPVTFLI